MRNKVSSCQRALGAAYLGAGAPARRARGGRRTGAPGPAAWWGRASGAAARGPRAGGRSRMPGARRGTHSARGRAGVGGGCAGPRPAATIPPAAPAAESRAAAALARRLGRLGCRRSGRPGGRPRAGEGLSPRCGRRLGSGTRPALRLPRAPHTPFFASAPPRPPSGPPGSTFLPSFLLPSLPFQAPARQPHGQLTAGRGGARSLPGQLRPRAGTGPGREAAGVQVGVPSGALRAGGVRLGFPGASAGGRGALRRRAEVTWGGWSSGGRAGSVGSCLPPRALAGGGTQAPARVAARRRA